MPKQELPERVSINLEAPNTVRPDIGDSQITVKKDSK